MSLTLSKRELVEFIASDNDAFYTEEETALLAKLTSGEIPTIPHQQAMAELKAYIDEKVKAYEPD